MNTEKIKDFFKKISGKELVNLEPHQLRTIILLLITAIVIMVITGIAVFSLTLRGEEQVLVPNVEGMELTQALLKLQEKELYPRITLRTSDKIETKGQILEQNPRPGTVVKAGRRIALVVNKGAVVDKVDNYVGKTVDEVKILLQSQFGASRQLIVIKDPLVYDYSKSPSGTILAQTPAPGTPVTGLTELQLVVSKGPEQEKIKTPNLIGLDISGLYRVLAESGINFKVVMRSAEGKEKQGYIVSQNPQPGTLIDPTEQVQIVCTNTQTTSGMIGGLFTTELPEYPYPLSLKLVAELPSGQKQTLLETKHPGKEFSLPYFLPENTVLVLSVLDRVILRKEIKN
ncbi:MAG TPA: PASTA domain-containing protein [Spirochaetia bacterium]|nr:PASTA domain-containing protein [Spirochaetales bacterium]HOT58156.1 PASTA domain-containing protein [Spirochaetales bacterium]HPD80197.1 PASTA domain-containing protein [Spirochaetales bacterium]HQK33360.1 PASTA domain-containing protein [Spirochaetales bacterium]HRS66496.1 PASTA domain-containing protein [Spirochaetia bacterium]